MDSSRFQRLTRAAAASAVRTRAVMSRSRRFYSGCTSCCCRVEPDGDIALSDGASGGAVITETTSVEHASEEKRAAHREPPALLATENTADCAAVSGAPQGSVEDGAIILMQEPYKAAITTDVPLSLTGVTVGAEEAVQFPAQPDLPPPSPDVEGRRSPPALACVGPDRAAADADQEDLAPDREREQTAVFADHPRVEQAAGDRTAGGEPMVEQQGGGEQPGRGTMSTSPTAGADDVAEMPADSVYPVELAAECTAAQPAAEDVGVHHDAGLSAEEPEKNEDEASVVATRHQTTQSLESAFTVSTPGFQPRDGVLALNVALSRLLAQHFATAPGAVTVRSSESDGGGDRSSDGLDDFVVVSENPGD